MVVRGSVPPVDWRQLRPRLVWNRCHRRRWEPTPELSFSREQRRKPRHVLLYVWAGHGTRRLPSGDIEVRPGSCHWSRPGWSYYCRQSREDPIGITAIHFDLVDPDGHIVPPERVALPPEVLETASPSLVDGVTLHIANLAMQMRSGICFDTALLDAAEALFRGLLLHLAAPAPGAAKPGSARATMWSAVADYIQEHLQYLPSVAELARHWGYSRYHFSRLFVAHLGMPPRTYIRNSRLALAKELLRETELSISQVAALAGYVDLVRFSHAFRQGLGQSPTAYRHRADEHL